ncbi:MAG TPA: peptidoglycan DD-metalloendopeptidase family protein [Anaerolineales bacterium]
MQPDPTSQDPLVSDAEQTTEQEAPTRRGWSYAWEVLVRLGLGEIALRIGTGLVSIVLIFIVLWVMGNFYLKGKVTDYREQSALAAPLPTSTATVAPPAFAETAAGKDQVQGITRLANMHTTLPSRPRFEISQYTVEKGDTITGIAEKFGLKPQTILWGNYYVLADDPHRLSTGQKLTILPVDGVYYDWHEGDGLNGVAKFFGVKPEDIINFQGNHLDPNTLGDWSKPNIKKGTWLVVPGGTREFVTWSAPRITRKDPAVAKIMGPGACGQITDGLVGTGTYVWPAVEHYLSGFDYSPDTNHYGLDIAGQLGQPLFAVDAGVVVYAGWNDWGYGNVVVIDHGNGWQSLYAHMSAYNVSCGTSVTQGQGIGAIGSTGNSSGPHLHFELRNDSYRANPWDFLPH